MPKVGEPGCRYSKTSFSKGVSLEVRESSRPGVRHA
jgi:hypothetical protein